MTRNLSRKAGDVFNSRTECRRSRRCENRALPQNSISEKYSIRRQYPSCFFNFCQKRGKCRSRGRFSALKTRRRCMKEYFVAETELLKVLGREAGEPKIAPGRHHTSKGA